MKRFLAPLILLAGAFLGTLLLQRYTFIWQEYDGLFLWTGDYFSAMFQRSFPISGIIGDFLTQFFRFSIYAPLIVAAAVVLAFSLVKGILSRIGLGWDGLSALFACALWVVIAFAPTARRGVAVVLILALVWAASRLLPRRKTRQPKPWIECSAPLLLTGGVFLFLSLNGEIDRREQTAALRVAVVQGDWDGVLSVATPARTAESPEMMPLAFLALGQKGQLGSRLFRYPVLSEADFDMAGLKDTYISLFFKAFLYSSLNCPHEAIHNHFQLAMLQEHGQSFMVLRQLMTENYRIGNYAMVKKYGAILSRSTLHGAYVRHFMDLTDNGAPRPSDSVETRSQMPLISHDPLYNLLQFETLGISSPASVDRILCTLLLKRDMERFKAVLPSVRDRYSVLPVHYEEALALSGDLDGLSAATRQRFAAFQSDMLRLTPSAMQKKYAETCWIYLLTVPVQDQE